MSEIESNETFRSMANMCVTDLKGSVGGGGFGVN